MHKFTLIIILTLFTIIVFTNCEKEDDNILESMDMESPYITGLSTYNFPNIDGSTSTEPLNKIIACKLFGISYQWVSTDSGIMRIKPSGKGSKNKFWDNIKSSQTHNSIINLIDYNADLILSARTMSPDEKAYAEDRGISLIETPIALDAFIIIVNRENVIQSLTIEQIQGIYTGKITNWNEVGGGFPSWENKDEMVLITSVPIQPFVRNPNSGSQELMELLVMKDLNITDFPVNEFEVIFSMAGALDRVAYEIDSICYTVYYYLEYQSSDKNGVKRISVNGINPTKATISNRSYPYTAEVYAIIRSDLDNSSMAYKLYEWLQTEHGKQVISESGYISY